MSVNTRNAVAYGLSQPLVGIFQPPIVSKRDPGINDKAPVGTLWTNTTTQDAFILSAISQNQAAWSSITGGGAFTTITASGNITSTGGSISTNVGDITSGGDITAAVNITAVIGDIVAANGDISSANGDITAAGNMQAGGNITAVAGGIFATAGSIFGVGLHARGDDAGTAGSTAITNVTNTTQGAGNGTIKSTSGAAITNTGFLKFYVGTTAVFVPYFTTIA
jgi:hypothetical protein